MPAVLSIAANPSDHERRLNELGLSTDLIHTALGPGLSRAANRSSQALRSTPGTDIYHDAMEHFHQLLSVDGWSLVYVDQQPRLLHPNGLMAFTVAAGRNVESGNIRRKPRTGKKGKATRESLAKPRPQDPMLFGGDEVQKAAALNASARSAPLWMLVHERTPRGLRLELSRPNGMTPGGIVNDWEERIPVAFLDLDGDLSIFATPDDDGDINFSVEPL
jgi:hypothetical protein